MKIVLNWIYYILGSGLFITEKTAAGEVLIEYEGEQMSWPKGETALDNHVKQGEGCYVVFAEKDKIQTA